jgi:hypothetical protein
MYLPVYRDICETRPDASFFLASPTPRTRPFWYADAQSNISHLLQLLLRRHQPHLLPLPGFHTDPTSLDTDGIHFTPIAGIAYCQHVIDRARYIFITIPRVILRLHHLFQNFIEPTLRDGAERYRLHYTIPYIYYSISQHNDTLCIVLLC